MKKLLKKLGEHALKAVVATITIFITTAILEGKPLTSLLKVRALFSSSVPAWSFAIALAIALAGIYHFLSQLLRSERKSKLHFVPDTLNCRWAECGPPDNEQMNVSVAGTLTFEGQSPVRLLDGYLKGTKAMRSMYVKVYAPDGSGLIRIPEIELDPHVPVKAFLHLYLGPVIGRSGDPVSSRLVFRDQYNHEHETDPVSFAYRNN